MGVVTTIQEYTSPLAAHRLFKALVLERHVVVPKLLPQDFKSGEIIQGDPLEIGTIRKFCFTEAIPYKYMVHRIDALDKENYYCKYTLIEGDVLAAYNMESMVYEIKLEASGEGSKAKMSSFYHPNPGAEAKIEAIEGAKVRADALFKSVENYLLSNPHVYA